MARDVIKFRILRRNYPGSSAWSINEIPCILNPYPERDRKKEMEKRGGTEKEGRFRGEKQGEDSTEKQRQVKECWQPQEADGGGDEFSCGSSKGSTA